jgi:hypothetical protein
MRANLSLWTQVLLDDGHTVPDWSDSNGPTDGRAVFVRRDICPKDGELYFPEAPGADRVEKCRACGHPRYVQSGPLAGKPTAYCFLFDLHLIFARWFGTPGLSSLFNPYHGDTRRGCIAGADGDLVPDPDFHIKVPPACWAWDTRHIVSHAGVSHAQDLFDTQCWRELVTLCPVMASSKKNPAVSIAQDSCKTTQNPSGSRTRHARSPAPSIITSMPRGSMHLTVMRLESAPPRLARSMHYLELLAILPNRCLDLVCATRLVMRYTRLHRRVCGRFTPSLPAQCSGT